MKKFLTNRKIDYRAIILAFIIFQAINIVIAVLAASIITPNEKVNFPDVPSLVYSFANFDGIHYRDISIKGYGIYQQAFFPLYPIIIDWVNNITGIRWSLAGIIISNTFFLAGLIIVFNYLKEILGEKRSFWTIIFILAFPTSFFFVSLYTEGIFFFLFIVSLYSLRKRNFLVSILSGFLLGLTRLVGLFLVIPLFTSLYKKGNAMHLFIIFAPLVGFLTYSLYLYRNYGDPFYFLTAQPSFGANRSSDLILLPQVIYRYVKIFITADWNFKYFVALSEFLIFALFLIVLLYQLRELLKNRDKFFPELLGLNLFSLVNILIPTMTGTFSSIPRYALLSISFFIALSYIENVLAKAVIIFIFIFFHIIFFTAFAQGYFIG